MTIKTKAAAELYAFRSISAHKVLDIIAENFKEGSTRYNHEVSEAFSYAEFLATRYKNIKARRRQKDLQNIHNFTKTL